MSLSPKVKSAPLRPVAAVTVSVAQIEQASSYTVNVSDTIYRFGRAKWAVKEISACYVKPVT